MRNESIHNTKGALSPARKRLVELMQELNFGRIEDLRIQDAEPVLDSASRVLREIALGRDNAPNPARTRSDFALKKEVVDLFAFFDRERSVTIEKLVVQAGLPVRMTVAGGLRVG